jgi:retinol dehydrogenase 12
MAPPPPRVVLVTGANTGIGRAAALELARRGCTVVLASRSAERNAEAADAIRRETGSRAVHTLGLDLASFASVRAAAAAFLELDLPLHVLLNNAGLAAQPGLTEDGFERTFGVNHLGHFLLTQLLLDRVRASAPARIVHVSSAAHLQARGIDYGRVRRPAGRTDFRAYSVSKLANVLFTAELARRLDGSGVDAYAVHPGVIASDIWRVLPGPLRGLATRFMRSVDEGARPLVALASDDDVGGVSGDYFANGRPARRNPLAEDADATRELWARSAAWTGADATAER